MAECTVCGKETNYMSQHMRSHAKKVEPVAEVEEAVVAGPRSRRAQRKYAQETPSPIDQIRVMPGGVTGPWAYYLRPDGATIRDALILYPNGGVPDHPDPRMRARYGTNAEIYRARQERKGFKFLGSKLTTEGVRMLVDTMARNREEEINFMLDEIDDADRQLGNGMHPEWYHVMRQRKAKAAQRIELLQQQWEPEKLVEELNEISRAQRMASIDPNVLAVMREMVGEVNQKFADSVAHFSRGKAKEDPELAGVVVRGGGGGGTEFSGVDFVDVQ